MKQSVFILPHLLPAFVWAATCYYPNGNSVTNDQTVPCNNINGAVSMCCVQSDKCLSNGLCKVAATSGVADSKPLYWRDTCSNSDWTNPGCLDICTSESDGLNKMNTLMSPCDGTDTSLTWCCGNDTSCCDTDRAVHLPTDIYGTTSAFTSSNAASSTSSPSSTSTDSSSQGSSSGLSSGAKAGVGVGVGVGVCLIIALLVVSFLLCRRRYEGNAAVELVSPAAYNPLEPGRGPSPGPSPAGLEQTQELDAAQVYEKPANIHDTNFELSAAPSSSQARR